jgi:hypothetical protein
MLQLSITILKLQFNFENRIRTKIYFLKDEMYDLRCYYSGQAFSQHSIFFTTCKIECLFLTVLSSLV